MGRLTASRPGISARQSWWLVTLACVGVAVGLWAPTVLWCNFASPATTCQWSFHRIGTTSDWRYFASAWETARVALVDFHQFPSWNPYHCGGLVYFQDPQTPFPGPMFLLTFWWLTAGGGIKLWLFAHLLVGALGARALIKDRGGNGPEQLLGAVLTAACGFVAWHTGGGHLSFTPFLFLPLIIWAFRRSLFDVRWSVLVAVMFAVAFLEGGTYPVPLMAVALAVDAVSRLGSARDRRALVLSLPVIGLVFPLLAGVRLLPVLNHLREHPRLVPLDDQMSLAEVFQTWLTRTHPRAFPGHPYVWDEYANYVGLIPVLLMLLGIAVAVIRRDQETRQRWIDLTLLAVLIWAALGNISGVSLFALLHELPIYASLRVPSRFLGPAMVGFALVSVSSMMAVRRWMEEKRARPAVVRAVLGLQVLLVLWVAVDVCLNNHKQMQQGMDPVLPRRPPASANFHQAGADYNAFPTFPVMGIGTRACYVPLQWKPAPGIVDGKVAQQRVEPPTAGQVVLKRWSPNEIVLEAKLTAPGVVVVNQNYETGWWTNRGELGAYLANERRLAARPHGGFPGTPPVGLIGVSLPAGTVELTLRHWPRGLLLGSILTGLGIALSFLLLRTLKPARVESWWQRARSRFSQRG